MSTEEVLRQIVTKRILTSRKGLSTFPGHIMSKESLEILKLAGYIDDRSNSEQSA